MALRVGLSIKMELLMSPLSANFFRRIYYITKMLIAPLYVISIFITSKVLTLKRQPFLKKPLKKEFIVITCIVASCRNLRMGLETPRWHTKLVLSLTIFEMSENTKEPKPKYIICHFWVKAWSVVMTKKSHGVSSFDHCPHSE